ncbi:MAG: archease [Candidatus Omnitrophica bacterium]|nr:archease [Candidatus Omnitrophota bacterium]
MKNYELIEHTADFGIRVKGKDPEEVFKNAAEAMFDCIASRAKPAQKSIQVESRTAATRTVNLESLLKELESKGIMVKASGRGTIVEEAPAAYKDVNEVVDVVHNAGISKRVCRMRPVCVIKG